MQWRREELKAGGGGTLKMGENAKILKNGRKYENFEKWEKI